MEQRRVKITEYRFSVGRTINLGDFNSLRLEVGLTVSTEPGDDLAAIRREAHADLSHMLTEAWHAHKRGAQEE